ncbi:hypothetical protein Lal_00014146 [Lupinus albus]|nr:hypothetical protein Lal_00014146 [Lupinus albus]
MEQMHEIERILNNFKQHNMQMDEIIIVSSIIDKLHSSWKDFKRTMKHKKDDISLEQLNNHIRLEEDYRKQDDTKNQNALENVHVMEEGNSRKFFKKGNMILISLMIITMEMTIKERKKRKFVEKKNKKKNSSEIKYNLIVTIVLPVHKNKELFKTIDKEDGSVLYMRNVSTVHVKGKRTVEIEA